MSLILFLFHFLVNQGLRLGKEFFNLVPKAFITIRVYFPNLIGLSWLNSLCQSDIWTKSLFRTCSEKWNWLISKIGSTFKYSLCPYVAGRYMGMKIGDWQIFKE